MNKICVVYFDKKTDSEDAAVTRENGFSISPFLFRPLSRYFFLSFSLLANRRIAVRWEWKFGTINSNGAYVLGDLLLGSLLALSPSSAPFVD